MSVFRTRVLGLLLATVVAAGSPASAQHDVPDVVLDSLMVAAVAHNPDILAAEQKVDALKQHEAQVSALDDPMISYSHWLSTPETRVGPQTDAFMLSQPIPFPGKLGLRGDIASEEATSEAQRADATRRDVLFKVKSAYYNLYRIDQSLAIIQ